MTSNRLGFLQDKAESKAWSLRKTLGSPSETPSVCLLRNDPGCSRVLGTVTFNVFPGGRLPFQSNPLPEPVWASSPVYPLRVDCTTCAHVTTSLVWLFEGHKTGTERWGLES